MCLNKHDKYKLTFQSNNSNTTTGGYNLKFALPIKSEKKKFSPPSKKQSNLFHDGTADELSIVT